jgi:hypothetical protein
VVVNLTFSVEFCKSVWTVHNTSKWRATLLSSFSVDYLYDIV